MIRTLVIIGAWLCGTITVCQPLDSLLARLDSTRHDTIQAELNEAIGIVSISSAEAESHLKRAVVLYEELSRSPDPAVRASAGRAFPIALSGFAFKAQLMGDNLQALAFYRRGETLYEQRRDTSGIIGAENNIGLLFQKAGERQGAMAHFRRALAMAPSARYPMWPASLRARMAALFVEMGELDSADAYLNESLKDRVTSSLDYRYRNQALLREKQGRIAEALALLDSSVAVEGRNAYSQIGATSYLHLARILEQSGQPGKAMTALDSCLAHFENDDKGNYCQCLQVHGSIAWAMGRQAMAEKDLTRALAIADQMGLLRTQLAALGSLRDLYRRMGRYALAFRMADRWQLLSDSLNGMDAKSELLSMDFRNAIRTDSLSNVSEMEHARAESEVRLAKERTRRNVFLFSGLGLLVFGIVVYRQRRRTQKALDRSDELLLNILPQEVAEELKEKGQADAKHFASVTILFTDFKGFTSVAERLSPQELVEELNTCFKAFDHIVTARGIEKIKTIGDAYMCAGGLPVPSSSTPAGVVQAALEMQAFMIARKAERDAQGKPAFEMRVGVHTGPVVAGIVGVKKFQYDIWGDTVNIASRMESSGEVGQVNISEATYELVKGTVARSQLSGSRTDNELTATPAFIFTPRGKVQAKGKGEMEMYFVNATGPLPPA